MLRLSKRVKVKNGFLSILSVAKEKAVKHSAGVRIRGFYHVPKPNSPSLQYNSIAYSKEMSESHQCACLLV